MPALNVSEKHMEMVEEIVEELEIRPTKREVGNQAIERMHKEIVVQGE